MRILRIARKLPPMMGGQEFHVRDLSLAQAEQGHSVTIVFKYGRACEQPPRLCAKRIGREVDDPRPRKDSIDALGFSIGLMAQCGLRAASEFDLIHVHGDIVEVAAALLLARANVPVVVTLHAGLNRGRLYRFVARRLFRRVAAVICVSADIAEQVAALGVPSNRLFVISSGIHYELFAPRSTSGDGVGTERHSAESIRIVSVGRLVPMKGYFTLLAAVKLASQRHPVHLTLIGDGPEYKALIAQAERDSVPVEFLGRKEKSAIAAMLPQFDVFVSSSITLPQQQEGTPTVVMEAMAAGLPIVATDVGGAKSIVVNGENGYVVSEGDPVALADKIVYLATDNRLREEIGGRNRTAAKRFDWRVTAGKIEKVYGLVTGT